MSADPLDYEERGAGSWEELGATYRLGLAEEAFALGLQAAQDRFAARYFELARQVAEDEVTLAFGEMVLADIQADETLAREGTGAGDEIPPSGI